MSKGTAILIVLLMGIIGVQTVRAERARRGLEIAEANEQAALDTTRTTLRDSVAASTRLAAQARLDADSLSAALSDALQDRDAALVAVQESQVAFDSVVALGQVALVDTVVVEGVDTVRIAVFELTGPPISGQQTVRAGPTITLDSRLNVTPFSVTYGLACQNNAPVFAWETPDWVTTQFDAGTVSPDVCYQPPPKSLFSIDVGRSIWAVGGGVLGFLLGSAR